MARPPHPIETLSQRERDVLRLIAEGKTNPQVAEALAIRFETAKWYVSKVISKLAVASREEAAAEWRRYHRLPARVQRVLAPLAKVKSWKLAAASSALVGVAAGCDRPCRGAEHYGLSVRSLRDSAKAAHEDGF